MSYLFIKKSVSKRKVCIILIKNLKFKKTQKNNFSGFFYVVFFLVFWVGFLLPTLLSADSPGQLCSRKAASRLVGCGNLGGPP